MTRKAVFLGIGTLLFCSGLAAALLLLVWHEPDFYVRGALPPGEERRRHSGEFQSDFLSFCNTINSSSQDPKFSASFTDLRINSYFDEDFVRSGIAQRVLPEGITQPRIAIEPKKIRLAFRYGSGAWSAVISIDLRVWLADRNRSIVGLELQSLHAGSVPISAQSLLERVSEAARQQNIEVTWYRLNGNPAALLRFQADRQHPTIKLQQLQLLQGMLLICGSSAVTADVQAMLPMAEVAPSAN